MRGLEIRPPDKPAVLASRPGQAQDAVGPDQAWTFARMTDKGTELETGGGAHRRGVGWGSEWEP